VIVFGGYDGRSLYKDLYLLDTKEKKINALSQDFKLLLESAQFVNITLMVDNKEFNLHKPVLQARCPQLLEEDLNTKLKVSEGAFELFLLYLYSDEMPEDPDSISPKDLLGLLVCARRFNKQDLEKHCLCILPLVFKAPNISEFVKLASEYQLVEVLNSVQRWVNDYGGDLLSPELLGEIVQKLSPKTSGMVDLLNQSENPLSAEDKTSDQQSAFATDFANLFKQQRACDFDLIIEGQKISCHKAVLACRCDFFCQHAKIWHG